MLINCVTVHSFLKEYGKLKAEVERLKAQLEARQPVVGKSRQFVFLLYLLFRVAQKECNNF